MRAQDAIKDMRAPEISCLYDRVLSTTLFFIEYTVLAPRHRFLKMIDDVGNCVTPGHHCDLPTQFVIDDDSMRLYRSAGLGNYDGVDQSLSFIRWNSGLRVVAFERTRSSSLSDILGTSQLAARGAGILRPC
jgi:hypothetical protein